MTEQLITMSSSSENIILFAYVRNSESLLKGSYDAISCFAVSLECYKLFGIDKIPEVAKTKVPKPKRYSLSKLRLCHAP